MSGQYTTVAGLMLVKLLFMDNFLSKPIWLTLYASLAGSEMLKLRTLMKMTMNAMYYKMMNGKL